MDGQERDILPDRTNKPQGSRSENRCGLFACHELWFEAFMRQYGRMKDIN